MKDSISDSMNDYMLNEIRYAKRNPDIAPFFNNMDEMSDYLKLCREVFLDENI